MSNESSSRSGAEAANNDLWVIGVGREGDYDKTLLVYFNRTPTDDEMRAFHDSISAPRSEHGALDAEYAAIERLADHAIPVYAYGDNEAANDMSARLAQILEIVRSSERNDSQGEKNV